MSIFGNNKKHNDKFLKEIRNRIMMKFLSIIPTSLTMDYASSINPEFGCCEHSITINRSQMSRISGFIMQCIVLNEVASTEPSNVLILCK